MTAQIFPLHVVQEMIFFMQVHDPDCTKDVSHHLAITLPSADSMSKSLRLLGSDSPNHVGEPTCPANLPNKPDSSINLHFHQ